MKKLFRLSLIATTGIFFLFGAIISPYAQETGSIEFTLEEITVTAEKRDSDEQKTAVSVSVVSGHELTEIGKYTIAQKLEGVPGVTIVDDNIIIRGALPNKNASLSSPTMPTTAVYVDDVFQGVGGEFDVDHMEVLRGPQGTLYGRSATGGVVAQHTKDPSLGEFEADVSAEYGSYNIQHATAVVNVPIGENLALRVGGNTYKLEGYEDREGGRSYSNGAKGKLLYQPNEDFSLLLGWAIKNTRTYSGGTQVSGLTGPNTFEFTTTSIQGPKTDELRQYWAKAIWDFGAANLTYIPALRQHYTSGSTINSAPLGLLLTTEETPQDEQMTHEIRLSSDSESKLTWQTGALYYKVDRESNGLLINSENGALGTDTSIINKTRAEGLFAEGTYPFSDTLRFTGGLRYDHTVIETSEDYTVNTPQFGLPENISTYYLSGDEGKSTFNIWTYKVRLEKDLAPSNMLYATISTGFLPGDVQVSQDQNDRPTAMRYDQETLTAYEIGSKNRFLSDTLQVNGSMYYYDYSGYIASLDISTESSVIVQLYTVPAKMTGFEIEGAYQITYHDKLTAGIAYTNAKFVDQPDEFKEYMGKSVIQGIPTKTANASYEHAFYLPDDSVLNFRLTGRYIGSYLLTTIAPDAIAAGYEDWAYTESVVIGDMNATWTSAYERYSVTGYIRNLGDKRYKNMVNFFKRGGEWLPNSAGRYDPRTWGIVLNIKF